MTARLVIQGRLPSLNEFIAAERAHRLKAANMKRSCEVVVCTAIAQQLKGLHIKSPCKMTYTWVEKDARRDLDNVSSFGRKVIQDALVKSKVIADDGWKEITGFSDQFRIDKTNPRIEVVIEW